MKFLLLKVLSFAKLPRLTIVFTFLADLVVNLPTEKKYAKFDSKIFRQGPKIPINLSNTLKIISDNGYAVEQHKVTTPDGYILTMIRMPYAQNQTSAKADRPVVFCMHGLLGHSLNFVTIGPKYSPGFNFADAGFDVWLGNSRGNIESRAHMTLNPDNPADGLKFFDFSWDEIGIIDLPTMVNYILNYTKKNKLHFIGHSQGGTGFLVMASMRPEMNKKMASVHLLASKGYVKYFPNTWLTFLANMADFLYKNFVYAGSYEATPALMGARIQEDPKKDNIDYEANFGGGSTKEIAHHAQNIRDRKFRRFFYSEDVNKKRYNSTEPPDYNLKLITSPVIMHYSPNDDILDERDVLAMAKDIKNCKLRKILKNNFRHEDFVVDHEAKTLVTEWIIEYIYNVHGGRHGVPVQTTNKNFQHEDFHTTEKTKDFAVNPDIEKLIHDHIYG